MIARSTAFVERHAVGVGVVLIVTSLVLAVALFNRQQISVLLSGDDTVTAAFDRGYRLDPYATKVKVAGVPVGVVTGMEERGGDVVVSMAVDPGTADVLGSEPSAAIRPLTLLGGQYYVDLQPGGDRATPLAGTIPASRTTVPVEVGSTLEVLQQDARDGATSSITNLDAALGNGGGEAAQDLVRVAPDALEPAADVLDALRGEDPDDLADLVVDLEAVTAALTDDPTAVEDLLSGAGASAAALGDTADDQRELLDGLAATLRRTRTGMQDLSGSLMRLRDAAGPLRPSVVALADLLERAEPVLAEARPVVRDLRPTLADLRPVVGDLQPLSVDARGLLGDLEGPVLDRLNGRVVPALNRSYRGEDALFREEIAYMFAGLAGISQYTDSQGSALSFHPGLGIETVGGVPTEFLDLIGRPRDPEPGAAPGEGQP